MNADRAYVIRTPEQVEFRYELAGPAERVCAWLVDLACLVGLMVLVGVLLARAGRIALPLILIAQFLLQWGYFLWFEWRWNGGTPGKRLMGLRVMQVNGARCSFERLALRNFLRVADFLPFLYALGGTVMLLNRRGARLGDLAAGTVCVRVPRPAPPAAVTEIRMRFNSLKEDGAARRRIHQLITPDESRLVLSLAFRRGLLDRQPRLALFARAAAYLRRRLRLSGHEALPDESLVMNVAAVLLEEKAL